MNTAELSCSHVRSWNCPESATLPHLSSLLRMRVTLDSKRQADPSCRNFGKLTLAPRWIRMMAPATLKIPAKFDERKSSALRKAQWYRGISKQNQLDKFYDVWICLDCFWIIFIECRSDPVGCDPSNFKGLCVQSQNHSLSNLWIAHSIWVHETLYIPTRSGCDHMWPSLLNHS